MASGRVKFKTKRTPFRCWISMNVQIVEKESMIHKPCEKLKHTHLSLPENNRVKYRRNQVLSIKRHLPLALTASSFLVPCAIRCTSWKSYWGKRQAFNILGLVCRSLFNLMDYYLMIHLIASFMLLYQFKTSTRK